MRRPGSKPAYDLRLRSIQALFAETFLGRPFPSDGSTVVLGDWLQTQDTSEPEPHHRKPMPDFGACDGAC